jgi:hypothetical protein
MSFSRSKDFFNRFYCIVWLGRAQEGLSLSNTNTRLANLINFKGQICRHWCGGGGALLTALGPLAICMTGLMIPFTIAYPADVRHLLRKNKVTRQYFETLWHGPCISTAKHAVLTFPSSSDDPKRRGVYSDHHRKCTPFSPLTAPPQSGQIFSP